MTSLLLAAGWWSQGALAEEATGSALVGDGAVYRSGLVERWDVFGGEKIAAPHQPAVDSETVVTPVSITEATISRMEVPSIGSRTWIWVMIGFAALLGLFLSARQTSD
jgi:hypothetical protein